MSRKTISTNKTGRAGDRCNTVLADLMNIDLDLQEPTAVPGKMSFVKSFNPAG
jgi:hypothetical protein